MVKKFLVTFMLAVFVVASLAIPHTASAQNWWAPTHGDFNSKINNDSIPDNEIFGERYTHAQTWWIVYSLINLAFGTNTLECAATYKNDLAGFSTCQKLLTYSNDNGIFAIAQMNDQMLSSKPLSGISYTSSVASKIWVPTAEAQQGGFGFTSALQPLLGVWAAARNAAYALMALAVIVLAFMIMFRARISPQVSVSVMSAIPRIIIGFLLITFSYAIAGFVVDLAYVAQGIISALVHASGLINTSGLTGDGGTWSVVDVFNQMNDVRNGFLAYGLILIGLAVVIEAVPTAIATAATGGVAVVAAAIVLIILLIIFIVALIRVFWLLLKTYVMILFHVIALPFAALGYVVSQGGNPFLQLLRSLAGHVSVFVTITLVTMFANLMFWAMSGNQYSALEVLPLFNPYRSTSQGFPANTGLGMPGFGSTDVSTLALFIGLVILLTAPGIANNVRELIATGRASGRMGGMIGVGAAGVVAGSAGIYAGQKFANAMDTKAAAGSTSPGMKALAQTLATLTRTAGRGKIR